VLNYERVVQNCTLFFPLHWQVQTNSWAYSAPYTMATVGSFTRVRWCETDNSPPFSRIHETILAFLPYISIYGA